MPFSCPWLLGRIDRGPRGDDPNREEAMLRRVALSRTPWLTLAALLVAVIGCVAPQVRTQSDESAEAEAKYDVQTVGDVTDVGNADPIQVGGVGLVIDLEGTGGSAP